MSVALVRQVRREVALVTQGLVALEAALTDAERAAESLSQVRPPQPMRPQRKEK